MKKQLYFLLCLFFIYSAALSQTVNKFTTNSAYSDSTIGNFKLTFGYNNLHAFEGVKYGLYLLNLHHGGEIGFTLNLSTYVDLEANYQLFYSNIGSYINTGILGVGLKINLIKNNITPYIGFGCSGCITNDAGHKVGGYNYSTLTAPLGVSYKISDKLELDLNTRFSLKLSDFKIDRIIFHIGVIHDI